MTLAANADIDYRSRAEHTERRTEQSRAEHRTQTRGEQSRTQNTEHRTEQRAQMLCSAGEASGNWQTFLGIRNQDMSKVHFHRTTCQKPLPMTLVSLWAHPTPPASCPVPGEGLIITLLLPDRAWRLQVMMDVSPLRDWLVPSLSGVNVHEFMRPSPLPPRMSSDCLYPSLTESSQCASCAEKGEPSSYMVLSANHQALPQNRISSALFRVL